jgi:ribosome recycling factor
MFKLVLKVSSWRRNVRREAMKQVDKHEKDGDISEDEKKSLADSIQELTDDYVKQIDKLAKAKQDELVKI